MVSRGGPESAGTHNGPTGSPRLPEKTNTHMHYEVAQRLLSANFRSKDKVLRGVTIEEVEATIEKEDGKNSSIDQGIDQMFQREQVQ